MFWTCNEPKLDRVSCYVLRVKEKKARCWVWMGSWSLPGRELFECLLGTRCHPLVRDSLCGVVSGLHPRRPSGGATGTFTQQRARINSSISCFPQAPPQGSRGPHRGLSSTFSWQAPEMHDALKEQPFQGTAQSRCEWWDEVGWGEPGWGCCTGLQTCSVISPWGVLCSGCHSLSSGLLHHRIQGSGHCPLAFVCFFLAGHLKFSEFRLFQKLPVIFSKIILASLHGFLGTRYYLRILHISSNFILTQTLRCGTWGANVFWGW